MNVKDYKYYISGEFVKSIVEWNFCLKRWDLN